MAVRDGIVVAAFLMSVMVPASHGRETHLVVRPQLLVVLLVSFLVTQVP